MTVVSKKTTIAADMAVNRKVREEKEYEETTYYQGGMS
jgi:hypothetical protein